MKSGDGRALDAAAFGGLDVDGAGGAPEAERRKGRLLDVAASLNERYRVLLNSDAI
jgi:hypothetical protein